MSLPIPLLGCGGVQLRRRLLCARILGYWECEGVFGSVRLGDGDDCLGLICMRLCLMA